MNTSIAIGSKTFPTKAAAEKHIREILGRYGNMQALAGDDLTFVVAILAKHPNYDAIVDCGVQRIVVQHLHDRYDSRRFLLERIDGSIRDFTWRTSLTPKTARARVMKACRYAIKDQIKAFRLKAFDHAITQPCAISGQPVTPIDCDVDHVPPATFEALVEAWLRCNQLDESDVALVPVVGYEQPDKWEDAFLEENWREYHKTHARLRIVNQTVHRSLRHKTSADAQ